MASSLDLIQQAILDLPESDAPHLDARWLLAALLDVPHNDPSLRTDLEITEDQVSAFREQVRRRASGEPLAHILGEWEFYGRRFIVNPDVLIPRPDTELLVDWGIEILKGRQRPRVAEIGVGSLAVLASLALEIPDLEGDGVDVSAQALAVSRQNCRLHALDDRLQLHLGHHFEPLSGRYDLLISNPPYIVPGDPELEDAVERFEPEMALLDHLDGDGWGHHRALIDACGGYLSESGGLLLECGRGQTEEIERYALGKGWDSEVRADLSGILRAVYVYQRGK